VLAAISVVQVIVAVDVETLVITFDITAFGTTVTVVDAVVVPLLFDAVRTYIVVVEGETDIELRLLTSPTPLSIDKVGLGMPNALHDNIDEKFRAIEVEEAIKLEILGKLEQVVALNPVVRVNVEFAPTFQVAPPVPTMSVIFI